MGGSSNSINKEELKRGTWTALEDKLLSTYIQIHGEGKWGTIPKRAGLKRCGKSCRMRWLNYLRPGIKRGNITHDEEELIIRLHKLLGNRWSLIAGRLPGRTDNEIKNYWNTTLANKAKEEIYPAKKSGASEKPKPSNSEPKVFRTKASRCKKVVIPTTISPSSPHQESSSTINLFNVSISSLELQGHQNQFTNQSQDLESTITRAEQIVDYDPDLLNYMSSGRNYFDEFEMNAYDFCRDITFESKNLSLDAVQFLPIDHKFVMNDWTTTAGFGGNGTMDLDSLAFKLDSQEWP